MLDLNQINKAVAIIQSHNSKDVQNYVKYCDDFNLDPAWINQTFINNNSNDEFILRGLRKVRAGAYWALICETEVSMEKMYFFLSIKEFFKFFKLKKNN